MDTPKKQKIPTSDSHTTVFSIAKGMLSNNEIEKAINVLSNFFELKDDHEGINFIIVKLAELKSSNSTSTIGFIGIEDSRSSRLKLINSILNYLDEKKIKYNI